MTFKVGHRTATPWRDGHMGAARTTRTCAGCLKPFSKRIRDCRSAHDCCSQECVIAYSARVRKQRSVS